MAKNSFQEFLFCHGSIIKGISRTMLVMIVFCHRHITVYLLVVQLFKLLHLILQNGRLIKEITVRFA